MYKLDNELGQQDFFQPRTIQHVQRQEIMHFLSDVIGDKTKDSHVHFYWRSYLFYKRLLYYSKYDKFHKIVLVNKIDLVYRSI